jgi:hypothetical protein
MQVSLNWTEFERATQHGSVLDRNDLPLDSFNLP